MNFTQWLIFLFTQAILMYCTFNLSNGKFLHARQKKAHYGHFCSLLTHTQILYEKFIFPSWQISLWPPAKLAWRNADKYINHDDTKKCEKKRKLKGSNEAALGSMVSKGESEICASTFLFFLPIISDFRCCTDISSSHSARLFGDYDLIGKKFS